MPQQALGQEQVCTQLSNLFGRMPESIWKESLPIDAETPAFLMLCPFLLPF